MRPPYGSLPRWLRDRVGVLLGSPVVRATLRAFPGARGDVLLDGLRQRTGWR